MFVYRRCPMCSKVNRIDVRTDHYSEYCGGELIQEALPELNPMEREFVKSGYCPKCQSMLFGTNYGSDLITKVKDDVYIQM